MPPVAGRRAQSSKQPGVPSGARHGKKHSQISLSRSVLILVCGSELVPCPATGERGPHTLFFYFTSPGPGRIAPLILLTLLLLLLLSFCRCRCRCLLLLPPLAAQPADSLSLIIHQVDVAQSRSMPTKLPQHSPFSSSTTSHLPASCTAAPDAALVAPALLPSPFAETPREEIRSSHPTRSCP